MLNEVNIIIYIMDTLQQTKHVMEFSVVLLLLAYGRHPVKGFSLEQLFEAL
jgi:hypothetical protein